MFIILPKGRGSMALTSAYKRSQPYLEYFHFFFFLGIRNVRKISRVSNEVNSESASSGSSHGTTPLLVLHRFCEAYFSYSHFDLQ